MKPDAPRDSSAGDPDRGRNCNLTGTDWRMRRQHMRIEEKGEGIARMTASSPSGRHSAHANGVDACAE